MQTKTMKVRRFFLFIVLGLLFYSCSFHAVDNIFIRLNQVGVLPDNYKTAIILSTTPLEEKFFRIKDLNHDKEILVNSINKLPYKLNSVIKY
ncbi:MAG: hypothetical protein ACUVRG_11175 [Ignavibacterium sp.]|uniref:hypothetical protein n=1 Tax=Ignavibacterium sp. TaxID=2651167 RepID=UPI00404B9075